MPSCSRASPSPRNGRRRAVATPKSCRPHAKSISDLPIPGTCESCTGPKAFITCCTSQRDVSQPFSELILKRSSPLKRAWESQLIRSLSAFFEATTGLLRAAGATQVFGCGNALGDGDCELGGKGIRGLACAFACIQCLSLSSRCITCFSSRIMLRSFAASFCCFRPHDFDKESSKKKASKRLGTPRF